MNSCIAVNPGMPATIPRGCCFLLKGCFESLKGCSETETSKIIVDIQGGAPDTARAGGYLATPMQKVLCCHLNLSSRRAPLRMYLKGP